VAVEHDERGPALGLAEDRERVLEALDVVGVADAQDVPAAGGEARGDVLRERGMSSSDTEGCPRFSYSASTACVFVRCRIDQSSIEAWPFESTKRSRLGQIGSRGSKRIARFQIV